MFNIVCLQRQRCQRKQGLPDSNMKKQSFDIELNQEERFRQKETDRQRETETERDRDKEKERWRETDRERQTDKERQTERETETETETETERADNKNPEQRRVEINQLKNNLGLVNLVLFYPNN